MTSTDAHASPSPGTLGLLGASPLTDTLTEQARAAGIATIASTNPAELANCQCLWVIDHSAQFKPLQADKPGSRAATIPTIVVIEGFAPTPQASRNLPTMRLTRPTAPASLAELTPAANSTDTLTSIFSEMASALGFVTVTLAGTDAGLATRVSHRLMIEAMALLGEGVPPETIESAATAFGLDEPPLAMLDQLSLKVMDDALHAELHALDSGHDHHPEGDHGHKHDDHKHGHDHGHNHNVASQLMPESAVYVLEKMAHGFDRMGADSGYGFYDHEEDGTRELWDGLTVFSRGAKQIKPADISDRLIYIQCVEALRCVAEGLVSADDANQASIAGWGFPSAGVLAWISTVGQANFERRASQLAAQYGTRFQASA